MASDGSFSLESSLRRFLERCPELREAPLFMPCVTLVWSLNFIKSRVCFFVNMIVEEERKTFHKFGQRSTVNALAISGSELKLLCLCVSKNLEELELRLFCLF